MGERVPVVLNQDRHPGVTVEVDVDEGRVTVVGVLVRRPDGVTLADLRGVPIPRLEAAWNDPESREGKWIRSKARRAGELEAASEIPKAPTKRDLRVAIPKGGRYPNEFYVRVASSYRSLVASGRRPAPALAEANGVPITTVHGWVKEARARGFLAPARKGGATG